MLKPAPGDFRALNGIKIYEHHLADQTSSLSEPGFPVAFEGCFFVNVKGLHGAVQCDANWPVPSSSKQ